MSDQTDSALPQSSNRRSVNGVDPGKISSMKPSLDKLYKFFRLEIERGYDNHAVMGGLERMLSRWENEARADNLPEDLIKVVVSRIQDYPRLSPNSRAETIEGVWKRIQRSENLSETLPSPELIREAPALEAQPVVVTHELEPGSMGEVQTQIEREEEPAQTPPTLEPKPARQATPPKDMEPAALNAPVTVLPGVGPRYAQNLARLGLRTLRDLLYYFPRRYDDYTQLKPINRLWYGEEVTVIGTVQNITTRHIRGGKDQIVEAILSDGTGALRLTWFNQAWISRRLLQGAHIVVSGKIEQYLGRLVMNNPEWEPLEQQQLSTNRIVPVYPLTAQITQRWLRRIMNQVVIYWAPRVQDPLPDEVLRSSELIDLSTALIQAHFPDSWDSLKAARQRLAFDEIFLLQLGVLRQKQTWQGQTASTFQADPQWIQAQVARLPYTLTEAQQRAIQDVQHDLASGHPMNRLLQGDVGSGKTIVAALAIALVTRQGAQAALMAPTSILAEQHYQNLLKYLATVGGGSPAELSGEETLPAPPLRPEEIRLMLGATPEVEKRQIRADLASGEVKLVIGTHALIEEPVKFPNLQLAVVDEQHRFGVEQRAALRSKGDNPHLLVMTATPIPRSLALTVYGDLDLSVMDEMPPGRQAVATYVLLPRERERAYSLIRSQIEQGRQAFIIYPLVEESENSEAKAAVEEHSNLQTEYFPTLNLGLLHGRMRPDEKDEVMRRFRDGEHQILVSTSVVEVGVDVPNATVMLIEGANRFGLAQLHQFRGRVGRGAEKSFCLLIPDSPDTAENERLLVMTETNDGFVLAERDLEQRGPGQFLGTRQSGFSELKLANLTDVHLIEKARRQAQALFEMDAGLTNPANQLLKAAMERAWGFTTGDIS
jgi:ATP-dependent DNA helicase RecG